jgi:hypothetical protein
LLFASPVTRDTSMAKALWELAITFDVRFFVVAVPVTLVLIAGRTRPYLGPVAFAVLLLLNVALAGPLGSRHGWAALSRYPSRDALEFLSSPQFDRSATYRLLRGDDAKVAMYQLVRPAGRPDSEMFPESVNERSFSDVAVRPVPSGSSCRCGLDMGELRQRLPDERARRCSTSWPPTARRARVGPSGFAPCNEPSETRCTKSPTCPRAADAVSTNSAGAAERSASWMHGQQLVEAHRRRWRASGRPG